MLIYQSFYADAATLLWLTTNVEKYLTTFHQTLEDYQWMDVLLTETPSQDETLNKEEKIQFFIVSQYARILKYIWNNFN